jgi:hypothetical protein
MTAEKIFKKVQKSFSRLEISLYQGGYLTFSNYHSYIKVALCWATKIVLRWLSVVFEDTKQNHIKVALNNFWRH